ncbi:NACHT domain-containing protein [Streptomyces cinereoruber]|uniref:NACHT domain-containing protein n=1 Tax=Streptomyces cinereoruber TaxID=67260 RepID=UPI003634231D
MEPMLAGMAGRLAGGVVQKSFKSLTGTQPSNASAATQGFPEWEEETDFRGGYTLLDPKTGEIVTILTQDQLTQITEFLEARECTSLTQFLLIARFGGRNERTFADIADSFAEGFETLVEKHCEDNNFNWSDLADTLWRILVSSLEAVFPSQDLSLHVTAEEQQRLSSYVGSTTLVNGRNQPANVAFRDLADIVGNRDRFEAARFSLYDIRSASAQFYSEVNLAHTLGHMQESFRFDGGVLYVTRNLRLHNSTDTVTDEFLAKPLNRPRCVVIGNPGVGKSTMVQHVVHKLSSNSEGDGSDFAPLVVQCRDFGGTDSNKFILDWINKSLRDNLQLEIKRETINDILTLGRALVVFDGIDEIIDIGKRQSFVRTIEQFAVRYPLAPILVTARRVGYQKAPLRSSEFDLYELDDYNAEQIEEYAENWFAATERTATEKSAFLRESATVPDVCSNPLMLSLLCALYRARGYIPRNRREVYKACADLLFQRWDSMRQIEQPMDHRQYGNRLMQDLAHFFYKSQSAQAGVEENQLRKVVSIFFTDTGSVEEYEASERAKAFLDFCADRAWLLTSQGTTDRGERLFGFTHRTFMEYFSAEEIVRRAHSLENLVDDVVRAYDRDSSSVLADVIIQCADEKYDRGAETIVAGILSRTKSVGKPTAKKYVSLSLRILNASPLPKRTTDAIFRALFAFWDRAEMVDTHESAIDLFDLYRDPRSRLFILLNEELDKGIRVNAAGVVARWARLSVTTPHGTFDEGWEAPLKELAQRLYSEEWTLDSAVQVYLINSGLVNIREITFEGMPHWLTHVGGFSEYALGPLSWDLISHIWYSQQLYSDPSLIEWVDHTFLNSWLIDDTIGFSRAFAQQAKHLPEISPLGAPETATQEKLRDLALWISCALYEDSTPSLHPFHDVVSGVHGNEWFGRVASTRDKAVAAGVRLDNRPRPFSKLEFKSVESELRLPGWFKEWCNGRASFTRPYEE